MSRSYTALPAQSVALSVVRVERRRVSVHFVSGFRAQIAEHLVRRWSPSPGDGEVVAPAVGACRTIVCCQ